MLSLLPERLDRLVLLGAHCDDIAIGAGGTLLTLCRAHPGLSCRALVLTGGGIAARGGGAGRARRVLPGRRPRRHRARPARRPAARPLGAGQGRAGGAARRGRAGSGARPRPRTTPTRTTARSPSWCPPRSATTWCSATRSSSGRATSPSPTVVPAARRAGAAGEGRQAARALRLAARPHLVRRRGVPRPGPDPRHAVPRPLRRGVPAVKMVLGVAPLPASTRPTSSRHEETRARTADRPPGLPGHRDGPVLAAAGHEVTGLDTGLFADCVLGGLAPPTRRAWPSTCATSPPSSWPGSTP